MTDRYLYFEVKIPFDSIKIFSAALHLLHKLGRDCTIEVEQTCLTLRSLNDSKTAFGSVEFLDQYFDSFMVNETKSFSCKLALKPVCIIIRNVKNVRFIKMSASRVGVEHELSLEMHLSNGITRTHRLIYSDCEIMNALFEEEGCNYVKSRPGVFCQLLDHLHRSPEVCVQATPTLLTVSSYHKASAVSSSMSIQQQKAEMQRHMATGISVNIIEFDVYQFRAISPKYEEEEQREEGQGGGVEELIFCTKEVNSFLGFCEALDVPSFDYYFTTGGRASKYACRLDGVSVSLILATIVSDRQRTSQQQHQMQQQHHQSVVSRSTSAAGSSRAGSSRTAVNNGSSSSSSSTSAAFGRTSKHPVRDDPRGESEEQEKERVEKAASSKSKKSASTTSAAATSAVAPLERKESTSSIFENASEMREALKLQQMFDEQKKLQKRNNSVTSNASHSKDKASDKKKASSSSSGGKASVKEKSTSAAGDNFLKAAKKTAINDDEEEAEFDEPLPAPLASRLNSVESAGVRGSAVTPSRGKKGAGGAKSRAFEEEERDSDYEEEQRQQQPGDGSEGSTTMGLRSASRETNHVSSVNRYIKQENESGENQQQRLREEEEVEWSESQITAPVPPAPTVLAPTAAPAVAGSTKKSAVTAAVGDSSGSGVKPKKSRKKRLFEDSEEDD